MSAVEGFLKKVSEDHTLQKKLSAATAGATAAVAAEHGFVFTGDEYLKAVGSCHDKYLEAVAGGIGSAWGRMGESDLGRDAQSSWEHF
jgi:predicted ribosomally synthesized peptide with nif11-like leader